MSGSDFRRIGIVDHIVHDLLAGLTVADCAHKYRLPRDFVEQIVTMARERGTLDIVSLDTRAGCGTGGCQPDPESLVCAGCPLR